MATLPRPDANQRLTIVLDEPGGQIGLIPIVDSTGRIITVIGAGDSVIGRVKITDGTDVADVLDLTTANPLAVAILDGNGDQITSFGGGTQYTEDAAAAANPVGTALILVRQDTPAALVTTDGDNVAARGTNFGAQFVQVLDSSGNFIDSFGGAGGTSAADDADFTATTTLGTPAMGVFESTPSNVTDGDLGIVGITTDRRLKVLADLGATDNAVLDNIDADLTTIIGHVDGVEGLLTTIDGDTGGILTATQLLDDTVYVDDADWTDSTSKHLLVGGLYQSAPQTVTDGDVAPFNITVNGALHVAQQGNITADLGATDNAVLDAIAASVAAIDTDTTTIIGHVDGIETLIGTTNTNTGNAATSLAVLDDWDNGASDGASVSGDVAHDTADAGEPVKLGFKAIDIGTQPTAVAANDRSNWYGTRNGVPWFLGGSPATLTKELNVTDADGAQTDTALVTVAAGTAIVVTMFQAMCDGANTGDVAFRCGFGTANTPAADAAGIIASHPGVVSGSGVVVGSGAGIIGMGASNEDLRVTCEDPAGGAINFIVTYHTVLIG